MNRTGRKERPSELRAGRRQDGYSKKSRQTRIGRIRTAHKWEKETMLAKNRRSTGSGCGN